MGRKAINLPATNVARQEAPSLPTVSSSSKRADGTTLLPQQSVEPPPLVADLHPIRLGPGDHDAFSLQIRHDTGLSFIGIKSTGHWKSSGSSTEHCDLTIELEVHAQAENGRFKQFSFTIKLDDDVKDIEFMPSGEMRFNNVPIHREVNKGGGIKIGAQFTPAEVGLKLNASTKASYEDRAYAICHGAMLPDEHESRLRWILREHTLKTPTGITWDPDLPKPKITFKIRRERLRRVTLGYQITCEFEPEGLFRRIFRQHKHGKPGTNPDDFRMVSFDLTGGLDSVEGNAQGKDDEKTLSGLNDMETDET